MHQLGDQWIELIDGQEHMVRAGEKISEKSYNCTGCIFNGHNGNCMYHSQDCPLGEVEYGYIKDLGILRDGCLPTPWDKELYPDFYNASKTLWCIHAESNDLEMKAVGNSKQEAIDAWNRRE